MSAPRVFDRPLLRQRLLRARALGPATFLLDRVAEDAVDRLATILRDFPIAVDLGTPGPALRRALADSARIGVLVAIGHSLDALAPAGKLAIVADEEARQTADEMKRDLQARTEAEIAEMRARATGEIEAAKTQAIADLRGEVAALAIGAAEQVVERNLDRDTNVALIESYINQVGASR